MVVLGGVSFIYKTRCESSNHASFFWGKLAPCVMMIFVYLELNWKHQKTTFSTGIRPLTYAAGNNHEEVCVTLIAGSADVRAQVGAEEVPGEEGNRLCL